MKVSNLTKLSVVLRSDLKPDWNNDIRILKNQVGENGASGHLKHFRGHKLETNNS